MKNLEEFPSLKYLSVKKVEKFPIKYSDNVFKEKYKYILSATIDDRNYVSYIIPKTKEEWELQEKGYIDNRSLLEKISNSLKFSKSAHLTWEESQAILDKVNSAITKFDKLSNKDKKIPSINNIIIIEKPEPNAYYHAHKVTGATLIITTGLLEKHQPSSQKFQDVINHEIGHHYDVVNNGLKTIKYDIKQHLQDSNPELLKWLLEKNVTDKDFTELAKSGNLRSDIVDIIDKKKRLSISEITELGNLYRKGNKDGSGEDNSFNKERDIISRSIQNFKKAIHHQLEFSADKYATILDCKTEQLSKNASEHFVAGVMNQYDKNFTERPPERKDFALLMHSHTHPNPLIRTIEMQKIIDVCHDTSTEDLMKLQASVYPKIPDFTAKQISSKR